MGSRRRLVGNCLLVTLTSGTVLLAGAPAQVPSTASAPVPAVRGPLSAAPAQSASPSARPQYAEALQRYCMTCHNTRLRTAGLSLDGLDPSNPSAHAEVWEKVVRKLRSRTMPPMRSPKLSGSKPRSTGPRPRSPIQPARSCIV